MKRRRILALTSGALTALAGCTGGTSTDAPTDSDAPTASDSPSPTRSTTPAATDSPTDSPTESPTDSPTDTATPVFNPVIYYDSCTQISVQAKEYDSVTLFLFDADTGEYHPQTFDEGYTGNTAFSGRGDLEDAPIADATVALGEQEVSRTNPEREACTATPTPTATRTPYQHSEEYRNLDIFSYKGYTDYYSVVYRIENDNNYEVKVDVTTNFLDENGEMYDQVSSSHVMAEAEEIEFRHDVREYARGHIEDHESDISARKW